MGVTIGCILGMVPLLWFNEHSHVDPPEDQQEQ